MCFSFLYCLIGALVFPYYTGYRLLLQSRPARPAPKHRLPGAQPVYDPAGGDDEFFLASAARSC